MTATITTQAPATRKNISTAIVEGAIVSTGFSRRCKPWEKHCPFFVKEGVVIGNVTAKAFQLKSGKISVWIPKSAVCPTLSKDNHIGLQTWFECRVNKWQEILFTQNAEHMGSI